MYDVKELKRTRAQRLAEANSLVETAKKESRSLTETEATTFEEHVKTLEKLDREIETASLDSVALARGSRVSSPLAHNDPGNVGTRHSYSILKAIRQSCKKGEWLDGLELEVHQDLAKRKIENGGAKPQGFLIPYDLPVRRNMVGSFARSFAFAEESPDLQFRAGMDSAAGAGSIATILDAR